MKQGDPLSSSLFNATLEGIFQNLDWEEIGIKVNGEHLNNLKFADDVVLIGKNIGEVRKMIEDLGRESEKAEMKMNQEKTKYIYI